MKQTTIFKLLTLLVSTSFLSAPSFGEPELCLREIQALEQAEQEPVTLQETLERAYMQNATLDAARAGVRALVEDVSQANADWRPSLSVDGAQTFGWDWRKNLASPANSAISTRTNSRSHSHSAGYTARIRQNIYKGGATVANIGQQESEFFAGKADLFSQEQQTLFDAIQAHVSVIANQDIVRYRQEAVTFYKKFLERAQAHYEVGQVGRTDVEAALADYEDAKAKLSRAIGELEAAKATYIKIVACSPDNLAPADVLLELPKCYLEALEVAQNENPSIKSERFKLEAAQYFVDVQFAGLLPTLDVQGTVGNNWSGKGNTERNNIDFISNSTSNTDRITNLTAEASLTVPVYAQGIPNSKVRQAYQQVSQQKVRLVQTNRDVEQATKTSWEQHIAARESLKGFLAAVKAGEVAVEGAAAQADVGEKTIVDVLFLQKDLIDAQIDLVNAQATLITSTYAVLQAMGSLMARNLSLNVQYYDPDAYYEEYKTAWIQFWQGEDWRYVKNEPCGPVCP